MMPNSASDNALREHAIGCILGVAIGDAMGLPLECKSPAIIRETHGYVDEYISNKGHAYKSVAKRGAGTISDDTQLTLALMDSFVRKGYSVPDLMLAHVEAYEGKWGTPVGWGGTTRKSVQLIKEGQSPTYVEEGAGNGPCMKIAPLSILYVYKCNTSQHGKFTNSYNASLLKRCREITQISHGDPRCIVAAYCQARMVIRALQNEIPEFNRQIAKLFLDDAQYAESKLQFPDDMDLLSDRMAEFLTPEMFELDTNVVSVKICQAQSSFVMNSYPLVAYCAAKYMPYKNFKYAITQTVNAGADADSNGAMVGAMMGAYLGYTGIPVEMVQGLRQWKMVLKEVRRFEESIR